MLKTYSIQIDGKKVDIVHNDMNSDGVVQTSEPVGLSVDTFSLGYHTQPFEDLRNKLGLPIFENLPIAKWYAAHGTFFKEGMSAGAEKQYSSIVDFCIKNKIDLVEVNRLTLKMLKSSQKLNGWEGKKYPVDVVLKAMSVIAIVLSLKNHPFYKAKIDDQLPNNKIVVDTVLALLREGKLKMSGQRPIAGPIAEYRIRTDEIAMYKVPDMADAIERAIIVHELYHFYTDYRRAKKVSVQKMEGWAYLTGMNYLVLDQHLDSEDKFERFVRGKEGLSGDVVRYALRAAYLHSRRQDNRSVLIKMEDTISDNWLLRQIIAQLPQRFNSAIRQAGNNVGSLTYLERQISDYEGRVSAGKKRLSSFISSPSGARCDNNTTTGYVSPLVRDMIYAAVYKKIKRMVGDVRVSRLPVRINLHLSIGSSDPEVKDILTQLRPFGICALFCEEIDGVK